MESMNNLICLTCEGTLSAFAAAKARQQNQDLASNVENGRTEDHLEDAIITERLADEAERFSDDGDEEGDVDAADEDGVDHSTNEEALLSSWIPTAQSVIEDSSSRVILRLAFSQTLCCVGLYNLIVQQGVVEVTGATLSEGPSCYPVSAPSVYTLPTIQCLSKNGATVQIYSQLERQTVINGLESFSPLFRRMWAIDTSQYSDGTASSRTFTIVSIVV